MRNPPSLLSLTIDSALGNLSRISDLSFLPEHILLELFVIIVTQLAALCIFLKVMSLEFDIGVCLSVGEVQARPSYAISGRTLKAGKLNEKILKLFLATGKEEILSVIKAFNIRHELLPVLPTRCSEKF
ncbi:uncharacterized protein LOC127257647 [Andrographis paniculata]|uniref:uncharacterized protein LOC127257647 n=1 Tax=Andrographis paniculata TaxID=175694 RepID=UPI0021E72087|nr:uncharacterized protein LOC127257647 [Andrographis paniculata]